MSLVGSKTALRPRSKGPGPKAPGPKAPGPKAQVQRHQVQRPVAALHTERQKTVSVQEVS